MFKKRCIRCGKISYSSTHHGSWICPYCRRDLTGLKSRLPHMNRFAVNHERKMDEMPKQEE